MYVNDSRAKILSDLVKSRGWGPTEKTLANGVLQLIADRTEWMTRARKAILASEGGEAGDAIQTMLGILDPDQSLFKGVTEEKIEKLRSKI